MAKIICYRGYIMAKSFRYHEHEAIEDKRLYQNCAIIIIYYSAIRYYMKFLPDNKLER